MNYVFDESHTTYITPVLWDCVNPIERFDHWILVSSKLIGKQPDSRSKWRAWLNWLSGLVPGSARLIFTRAQIIEETFLVANSNLVKLTSPRVDLPEASRKARKVEKAIVRCDRGRKKGNVSVQLLRRWATATRMQSLYRWLVLARVDELLLLRAERNTFTLTTTQGVCVISWSEVQIACLYRE